MSNNITLDPQLRRELVDLLKTYPRLNTRDGRDAWLMSLPPVVQEAISKRYDDYETDMRFIIRDITPLQLADGKWPLLILIDDVLPRTKGLKFGSELGTLRQKIQANLEKGKPGRVVISRPSPPAWRDLIRTNQEFARFIQRDVLVAEVRKHITETPVSKLRPVVLYGQPRVGKTNILLHLCEVLSDEYVPLFVDGKCSVWSDLDYFLCSLISQLTTSFNTWGRRHDPSLSLNYPRGEEFGGKGETVFTDYWGRLRRAAGRRRPVVMFDEVECSLDWQERLDDRILPFLTRFVCNSGNGCFVLAGSERIRQHERLSALAANGWHICVPYLGEEIVERCFSAVQDHFILEPDALECVSALCDGHPEVLQNFYEVIASRASTWPGKGKIGRSDIEPIVSEVMGRSREPLSALWVQLSPSERKVVELVSMRLGVLFDPVDISECYLEELFGLADGFPKPTTSYENLKDGVASLVQHKLVEWRAEDKGIFHFKLGILPLWFSIIADDLYRSRGMYQ